MLYIDTTIQYSHLQIIIVLIWITIKLTNYNTSSISHFVSQKLKAIKRLSSLVTGLLPVQCQLHMTGPVTRGI